MFKNKFLLSKFQISIIYLLLFLCKFLKWISTEMMFTTTIKQKKCDINALTSTAAWLECKVFCSIYPTLPILLWMLISKQALAKAEKDLICVKVYHAIHGSHMTKSGLFLHCQYWTKNLLLQNIYVVLEEGMGPQQRMSMKLTALCFVLDPGVRTLSLCGTMAELLMMMWCPPWEWAWLSSCILQTFGQSELGLQWHRLTSCISSHQQLTKFARGMAYNKWDFDRGLLVIASIQFFKNVVLGTYCKKFAFWGRGNSLVPLYVAADVTMFRLVKDWFLVNRKVWLANQCLLIKLQMHLYPKGCLVQ